MIKKLVLISASLFLCIILMGISLLCSAETFGQISSYISIACVVLSLVGVLLTLRSKDK